MSSFSIDSGNSTTFTDTTPGNGLTINFASLDNSFSIQINGVDLFTGGPAGASNELEFQTSSTAGQTVRFADGDEYESDTPAIWQLSNTNSDPVVRLLINPDGTISLFGVKANNGSLEPLELSNGLSVNTAAIAAAWNDAGPNTIVVDQEITGPTNASGTFVDIPCFTSGTLIETSKGSLPVEDLRVSDLVLTYDHGFKPVRWIGSVCISPAQIRANPKLRPILIRADALGIGYPKQNLIVSPQHRVLVSSAVAMRMFNSKQVLISAKKLLPLEGVETMETDSVSVVYWHILFDDHQIIWSNGSPTESLFTGPEALNAISAAELEEIKSLFPQICEPGFQPISARFIPKRGSQMKKLVQRHQANNKPLFADNRNQQPVINRL